MSGYLPRGLPASTADLATLAGIEQERRDLRRLHREKRIDDAALSTSEYVLDLMARVRRMAEWERQRQ